MKVLLINGSPHADGVNATGLHEMETVFAREGIETELIRIGHLDIRGCVDCGSCRKTGRCVIDDIVNEVAPKFEAAEGLVIASPVYYASANATAVAFMTRLFHSTKFSKRMKVGAAIVTARRGGCSSTFDEMNKFFTISQMPIASGQYWNSLHGYNADEARQDEEGLQIMRSVASNMSFLIKSIALGKEKFGLPPEEPHLWTNFI